MKISTLFYTLKQGIKSITRNKWFSLVSIATIAACLFLFGVFYAIVMNFQHIIKTAEEDFTVTVFFYEDTEDTRIAEIGDIIRIREEVAEVKYISADEAWEWFLEEYPGYAVAGYRSNPLLNFDNYEVYLKDVSTHDQLVNDLESIPEVRKVRNNGILALALSEVNMIVAYVSVAIIVILLAVSVFLIRNTVTTGIFVRQEEIGIMKYIGATDFFVRAPFVIEGILIGAIGAGIPLGIIYLMYNKTVEYISGEFVGLSQILHFLSTDQIFGILIPVSLGLGIGIGFLGSYSAVRKHLRV